ncbi:MAG TPA: hypothetical protein VHE55_15335 [Fimbriimonadaceae bacterium]|nr:hypothetical protein [Fimbriimonadaceae bacterium]
MYYVVSRWEPLPGKSEEFENKARKLRGIMKSQSGVSFLEGFRTEDGGEVAIVGYNSRADYDRIVNNPNGPFASAVAAEDLDSIARWVWSERGEANSD